MAQITLLLIIMNVTIGRIQYSRYLEKIIVKSGLKGGAYFTTEFKFNKDTGTPDYEWLDYVYKKLSEIDEVDKVVRVGGVGVKFKGKTTGNKIVVYDDFLVKNLRLPLYKGKWFSFDSNTDEYLNPVIISYTIAYIGSDKDFTFYEVMGFFQGKF